MCMASRLKSSIALNRRKRFPQITASDTRSADQTEVDGRGTYSDTRSRLGNRRLAVRRKLSFIMQYNLYIRL